VWALAASATTGQLWLAVGGLAFSILGGGLAMAWRLGRLEGVVRTTLDDHDRRLCDLEDSDRLRRIGRR
jgi:hypothetical protein